MDATAGLRGAIKGLPGCGRETAGTSSSPPSCLVRDLLHQYARLVSAFLHALLAPPSSSSASSSSSQKRDRPTTVSAAGGSSSPEELMQQILHTDRALLHALDHLREHQRQQQRLARLQGEVEKKDRVVEELASQLRRVQAILQRVIDSTSVKLVAKGDALSQDHAVDVDEVVAYAHKVSYTTSAPPNWNPNLPHMRMFQPPAPQEINILQGNYYHNTTNVPIPDYSSLAGMGPLRSRTERAPETSAGAPAGLAQPQVPLAAPSLIPIAELPPAPPSIATSEPELKQITLDLSPGEDEDSELEEDEDDW